MSFKLAYSLLLDVVTVGTMVFGSMQVHMRIKKYEREKYKHLQDSPSKNFSLLNTAAGISIWEVHPSEANTRRSYTTYLFLLYDSKSQNDFLPKLFLLVVFQFVHSDPLSLCKTDPLPIPVITATIHSAFPSAERTRISTSWLGDVNAQENLDELITAMVIYINQNVS